MASEPPIPLSVASAPTSGWWTRSTSSTSGTRTPSIRRGGTSSRTTPRWSTHPRPRRTRGRRRRGPGTRAEFFDTDDFPAPSTPASVNSRVDPGVNARVDTSLRRTPPRHRPRTAPMRPWLNQRCRGAAGRVVTNMEASLSVPTATSVRSVPVKLLMDNRVVINNHLSRGRGGKVSFTHVIGFAVVRAMATMPEMGYGFTQVDGVRRTPQRGRKPWLGNRPRERRRHAAVACSEHQGCPADGLRRFLGCLRRRGPACSRRQTRGDGLCWHHGLVDQPGNDRHQPFDPTPDGRTGAALSGSGRWSTRRTGRAHRRRRSSGTPCRRS